MGQGIQTWDTLRAVEVRYGPDMVVGSSVGICLDVAQWHGTQRAGESRCLKEKEHLVNRHELASTSGGAITQSAHFWPPPGI